MERLKKQTKKEYRNKEEKRRKGYIHLTTVYLFKTLYRHLVHSRLKGF